MLGAAVVGGCDSSSVWRKAPVSAAGRFVDRGDLAERTGDGVKRGKNVILGFGLSDHTYVGGRSRTLEMCPSTGNAARRRTGCACRLQLQEKGRGLMRYLGLATDYDGTLATDGVVDAMTVRALENLKTSGRRLLMVTGRGLEDLQRVFTRTELFDSIVAENGALLYDPASREEKLLTEPPAQEFLTSLRAAGVKFDVGRAIVASWTPAENVILEVIRRLGLDYQVIFNKGAVMVLPSGVNKATGLRAALDEMRLSLHNLVAIGDAENDHAFLSASECSVAVANALPALRERADIVTKGDHGAGVVELIELLLKDDLKEYDEQLERSAIS